ncbi:hypothetical protein NY78_4364 [Desulfovibrio sp. TomC]|nr:hypothetical protein NY78_4364 [Desulfovibrio sp. TomC]
MDPVNGCGGVTLNCLNDPLYKPIVEDKNLLQQMFDLNSIGSQE